MLGTLVRAAASVGVAALAWAAACGDGTGDAGAGGQGGAGGEVGCTNPDGPACHPPVPHAGAGTGPSSSTGGSGPGGGGGIGGGGEGGAGGSGGSSEPGAAGSGGSGPSGGSGGIEDCRSGLTTGDAELDVCILTRCCDPFEACSDFGADPLACIECFEAGGGPLCDAAIACTEDACGFATAGVCDSGVSTGDGYLDHCLGEACCAEHRACTSNGADVDACITCLEAGGGALCDAAIACAEASCGD